MRLYHNAAAGFVNSGASRQSAGQAAKTSPSGRMHAAANDPELRAFRQGLEGVARIYPAVSRNAFRIFFEKYFSGRPSFHFPYVFAFRNESSADAL